MGNAVLRLDVPDDLVDVGRRVHEPAGSVRLAVPRGDLRGDQVALQLLQAKRERSGTAGCLEL